MLKFLNNQYDKRVILISRCEKIKEKRWWISTKVVPIWEISYNEMWVTGLNVGDQNLFYFSLKRKFLQQLINRRGQVEVTIWSLFGSDIYLELDGKFYLHKENGPLFSIGTATALTFGCLYLIDLIKK